MIALRGKDSKMDEICRLGRMAFGKYVKTRKGKVSIYQ